MFTLVGETRRGMVAGALKARLARGEFGSRHVQSKDPGNAKHEAHDWMAAMMRDQVGQAARQQTCKISTHWNCALELDVGTWSRKTLPLLSPCGITRRISNHHDLWIVALTNAI
jgi:hypothetical protein